MSRKLLGRSASMFGRTRTYVAAGALEVDEIEGYSGTRRRVLFDEITLVTIDRRRRWTRVILFATALIGFGIGGLSNGLDTAGYILYGFAALFAIPLILELALGGEWVTVFGKRSSAIMMFGFRKSRARRAYETVCEEARKAQQR